MIAFLKIIFASILRICFGVSVYFILRLSFFLELELESALSIGVFILKASNVRADLYIQ